MLGQSTSVTCQGVATGGLLGDPGRLLAPGRWTRLMARSRRGTLDRAIATGADPAGSPLLAARATQLANRATRRRIAADLEHVAQAADERRCRFRTMPRPEVVRANRAELLELAGVLRRRGPVYARGVAQLELLVTDGAGPAYTARDGAALARQLRQARRRLSG